MHLVCPFEISAGDKNKNATEFKFQIATVLRDETERGGERD